jgi:hypothetical protein
MTVAFKDGNAAAQNMSSFADAAGNLIPAHSLDSNQATYRFSGSFTPQATGAVTVISIKGSATKTVRIKRILLGGVSTANAQTLFALQRTTALGAGGTAVNPTAAKVDSASAAATAVVAHYTTTLKAAGTATDGPLSTFELYTSVVTTPTLVPALVSAFPEGGAPIGQAITLRGVSDFLEIQSVNAGNLSAGTVLTYTIELVEDGS